MVERDANTLRSIAWREVFPWLNIIRVFRIAISARALALAAVAILITATGWGVIGAIFGTDQPATRWLEPYANCPWKAVAEHQIFTDHLMVSNVEGYPAIATPINPVYSPWATLTLPAFQAIRNNDMTAREAASLLLCGLLGVAVWAYFGAAICRMAAVQLAVDEQVGLGQSLRYACRKWPSYFAAPLLPVCGVLLAAVPVLVLGWIMRVNVGLLIGGVLWPLALAAGFFMALLLLGTLFGWPLMWATISTEGTDSFDALSRTYAYTFQRPLHYVFYLLVAGFIGWLGWFLVFQFTKGVVWMSLWAAGWGCGSGQVDSIYHCSTISNEFTGLGYAGAILIRFWIGCVRLLAVGYLFSYFWAAAAAIYLLLRRDVDATEMDEVHLDADRSEQTFDLPKVATDEAGAPVVKDQPEPDDTCE